MKVETNAMFTQISARLGIKNLGEKAVADMVK